MEQLEAFARWLESQVPPGRWHDKIFSYCERGGDPSFWAEPLNAWSNGAFHLASLAALILWLTHPRSNRGAFELLLILLVFVIGTGSFLFHTLATRWAAVADVAPIGLFMVLYVGYALRRLGGLNWLLVLIGLGVFVALLWQAGQMRCGARLCLGGSVAYLPALGTLIVVGLGLAIARRPGWGYILAGAVIFAVSLTLRTFDKPWCPQTAITDIGRIGTHYWWHILNALLLYLLLRAGILSGRVER
ncbi:MAG: hypothetical protein RIC14_10610 [Filomicrobium sp.]